jgi:molecular chaperone GrpE
MQEQDKLSNTEAAVENTAENVEPAMDVTPSLEETLRKAELNAEEHHDAWLRAKAETENVRRRAQEDIAKAAKFAIERFAGELLAVKDSLEAALTADAPSIDSLKSGTELTLKQLVAAFEKSNLSEVNPLGEKFDPHVHQAISMIDADQEPNTVVTVLQKGYKIADRVLRPALVIVAKPKA